MRKQPTWHLIEEDRSVQITANTDPFLKESFDQYIHISERSNPGRLALFNGRLNVSTIDQHVSGLVMNFSKKLESKSSDPSENSRLSNLLDRETVANLYLYADTITVKIKLHFPQSNVHIFARRLIFEELGEIVTDPLPFGHEFATGGKAPKTVNGLNGANAGNINLNVQSIEYNRGKTTKQKVNIPEDAFRNLKNINHSSWYANLRVFAEGSFIDLEYNNDEFRDQVFTFSMVLPSSKTGVPKRDYFTVTMRRSRKDGFETFITMPIEGKKSAVKSIKNDPPKKIRLFYKGGEISVQRGIGGGKFENIVTLNGGVMMTQPMYLGIRNEEGDMNHIQSASITIIRTPPIFSMNGGKGQNGERGGTVNQTTPSKSGNDAHPVSYEKVWGKIENFLPFNVVDRDAFKAPQMPTLKNNQDYHVELEVKNTLMLGQSPLQVSFGNKNATNGNNGEDAYKPGDGGNGGNGGTITYTGESVSFDMVSHQPGAKGLSPFQKGGRGVLNKPVYHMKYVVMHKFDVPPQQVGLDTTPEFMKPHKTTIKKINSRHGKDAVGKDGKRGKKGGINIIANKKYIWLHQYLLERITQYVKDQFMQGNRGIANWVLNLYTPTIETQEGPVGLQMQNLRNEIRVMINRLDSRLDYFGHPIGWVPRLTTVTNIELLKLVQKQTIDLIYYSNNLLLQNEKEANVRQHLKFAINQLKEGIEEDRNTLVNSHKDLHKIKDELHALQIRMNAVHADLFDLNEKAKNIASWDVKKQALFTGGLKILAGLCHFIPVGQPFVGEIAGGLIDAVGAIDINAKDPAKEGLNLTAKLAESLGSYISDNESDLADSITSGLSTRISEQQALIDKTDGEADKFRNLLETHQPTFNNAFESQQFKALQKELAVAQKVDNFEKLEFYTSADFQDLITRIGDIKEEIKNLKSLGSSDKVQLKDSLNQVLKSQKDLKTAKTNLEGKVKKRTDALATAGKITQQAGKGLSGIAKGLQTMMVNVDESDPKFQEHMEFALNGELKEKFTELKDTLDRMNEDKMPIVNKLIKAQNLIDTASGGIFNKMTQVATFSDQNAQITASFLSPETQLYLSNIMTNARGLILMQIDNLIKSYQYRFLRRVDSSFYEVHNIVENIQDFENKEKDIPNRAQFKNAYDFALNSHFNKLATSLLSEVQSSEKPKRLPFTLTLRSGTVLPNGQNLLDRLNQFGRVHFRLHDLDKGSSDTYNYRIFSIEFTGIKVATNDKDLSFRFGVQHSGESVIRNVHDGEFYYFTTIHAPKIKDSKNPPSFRRSWDAGFNRSDVSKKVGEKHNGITQSIEVVEDEKALTKLLHGLDDTVELDYKEHLPGATSQLTLRLYDHKIPTRYEITQLQMKIWYEYKQGDR